MKLTFSTFLLGASSFLQKGAMLVSADDEMIPTQTFFVPLPESDLFYKTFKRINSVDARGNVNSIIAISISTPNTIVWYDHHEDGYEAGYRNFSAFSASTQIWGDGNCANGFAFGTTCNSPADDVLKSGQSIVIENKVDVAQGANNGFKYDGGDKVLASYPIAITRGAYPDSPGSLMAGGVEVLDTSEWGTFYVAPVGQNVATSTSAFQHTAFYVMAKEDNTNINFSDGESTTLQSGESFTYIVKQMGATLTASRPVQVDLLVGDEGSTYQLRWYALFPRDAWTDSYLSPVGDTRGGTKIFLYNPGSSSLKVTVTHSDATEETTKEVCSKKKGKWTCVDETTSVDLYPKPYQVTVAGKSFEFTDVIPTGTGAQLTASTAFLALSLTDTVGGGQLFDWGFPVLPSNKLTEKVLIGWGYGCTNKNCRTNNNVGGKARSVVWVSPWEDADIYVDIDNDGTPEAAKTVSGAKRLSSSIIENGADLSGATIWAVKPGAPSDSMQTVPLAAAWGQNSIYSFSGDDYALDLGTLVPPFIGVRVDEVIDLAVDKDGDGKISPGDEVEYTIQVQNAGQRDYGPCDYKIKDPGLPSNLPRQKYITGTCVFINQGQKQSCNDASLNGGNGLCSPVSLPKRGGVHLYKFRATIGSPAELDEVGISNQGNLTQTGLGPVLPFSALEVVHFNPSINIEKTVHVGVLISCSNGQELVQGRQGDVVTYCFEVTNTGNTYLDSVVVTDPDNGMEAITTIPFMAPGEVKFVKFETSMPPKPITSNATVTGEPRLVNKNVIPTYEGGPVTDLDDAGVNPIAYIPGITVKKYAGAQGSSCSIDKMKDDIYLAEDTTFEYCYIINNIGDECLVNVTLTDSSLGGIGTQSVSKFCPGDSAVIVTGPPAISLTKVPSTDADVTGTGEYSGSIVSANDPAGVDVPNFAPELSVKKYAGPQGSSCNIEIMEDDTYLAEDTKFEYCYVINNTGNECVVDVVLKDTALGGTKTQSIPKLCPGDSVVMVTGPPTTSLAKVPSTDADVTGTGEYSGSIVSANDPAGVDVPIFAPELSVKKYAGPQGSSCNIETMEDDTYLTEDTKFEYCYVITNIGNECIVDVSLVDSAVGGIGSTSVTKICPGDAPSMIVGPSSSTDVSLPSTDATATGAGEYSGTSVSANDPAAVEYVEPPILSNPGINIEKTVHLGELVTCFNGQELEYGFGGTVVTYCYEVTNTGDIALNVVLTDGPVGTSESFVLSVGETIFVKKVSSILSDLASPGEVVGSPTDGGENVEDSDPAGVKVVPNKSVCE